MYVTGNSVKNDKIHPLNEPQHDKTNNMTCALSEDSDQPAHLRSLTRVFAVLGPQLPIEHIVKTDQLWHPPSLGRCPG